MNALPQHVVTRRSERAEAAYVEQTVKGHRRLLASLYVFCMVLGGVSAAFAAAESLFAAGLLLAIGGVGVGGLWKMSGHVLRARVTDDVVTLAGPVQEREFDGGDPLRSSRSIGGVRAVIPRGWASMVSEDDGLDADAVVVDTTRLGEDDPLGVGRRYVVVAARRDSDGAAFSVADEVAVGGERYHRPLSGVFAPVAWAFGVAVVFAAVIARQAGDAASKDFALVAVLVAAACFALALATGVPFLRSRSLVEFYRDRVGLQPAKERRQRRVRDRAIAAALGALAGGIAAPFLDAPVWLGAMAVAFAIVPLGMFRPLSMAKTRS